MKRRHFLAGAAALPLSAAMAAPALRSSVDDTAQLRRVAASHGLVYGCAAAGYELEETDFKRSLLGEAGVLVAEYEMKRDAIEPAEGRFDFGPADALVGFAVDHGLKFRGHTLVWHHSNPPWLEPAVRATRAETLFTDYIATMMRRYGGRVQSWDVVNEALAPKDGRPDGLRNSFWLETFGPSFIDTAFHAARAANPKAQLVYNDWGCEQAGAEHDRFRAVTLALLEGARARGVPIDALGLQGHLSAFGTRVDQKVLRHFLDDVASLGYRILVSEHDVDDSGGPLDIAARDRAVADASARFLDVVATHPACDAVLTWGLSDRFLAPAPLRDQLLGVRRRMLPLDRALRRKPMWASIRQAFAARSV